MSITTSDTVTDSGDIPRRSEPAAEWPATVFPAYADQYLRDFLAHLLNVSQGSPAAILPTLSEPSLYTLAVALARVRPALSPDAPATDALATDGLATSTDGLPDALLAELRWRNCRAMGTDPAGPARRGRLLQIIGAFGQLRTLGPSPLQRHKLAGRCPFCQSAMFQVFLPSVRWRCFDCQRGGGLLEFAECLLTAPSSSTRDTLPAA